MVQREKRQQWKLLLSELMLLIFISVAQLNTLTACFIFLSFPNSYHYQYEEEKLFWGNLFCEDILELVLNVLAGEPEGMGLKRQVAVANLT